MKCSKESYCKEGIEEHLSVSECCHFEGVPAIKTSPFVHHRRAGGIMVKAISLYHVDVINGFL